MPTPLKSATARLNGAKSRGPATPAGKARSSQNALKHGLHSKRILLPTESAEEFATFRAALFTQFQPATPLEADLVEILAATLWCLRRIPAVEASLLRAHSFEDLVSTLSMLLRREAALSRTFYRALKQLHTLQKRRNEPNTQRLREAPTLYYLDEGANIQGSLRPSNGSRPRHRQASGDGLRSLRANMSETLLDR